MKAWAERQAKVGVSVGFPTRSQLVTHTGRGFSCESCELPPAFASARTKLGSGRRHPSICLGRAGPSTLPREPSPAASPPPGPCGAAPSSRSEQIPSLSSSLHNLLFPMWKPNATSLDWVGGLQAGTISPPRCMPQDPCAPHVPEGPAEAELC